MATETTEKLSIDRKLVLTVKEAAEYSNIGENCITRMLKEPGCSFLLKNGNRRLIKRAEFEEYIKNTKELPDIK